MRPGVDEYFMTIAHATKTRSTCPRAMVGAVLVVPDSMGRPMVVSTGYNGAPAGGPHCDDVGCMLDRDNHCRLAVHAELNCLLSGPPHRGGTLYTTHQPCFNCLKAAINHGVERVVWDDEYPDKDRDLYLTLCHNHSTRVIQIGRLIRQEVRGAPR